MMPESVIRIEINFKYAFFSNSFISGKHISLEKVSIGQRCPAKCHSEKGFICNCNRYTMKLLLRPGHSLLYGTKLREDNSKTKNARLVFLVQDTSSQCDACTCKVLWIYSIWFRSYGPDTVNYMELSQGEIIQKPKMPELSSLFMTHRLNVMHAPV